MTTITVKDLPPTPEHIAFPEVIVLLAPNDAETYLSLSTRMRSERMRVTARQRRLAEGGGDVFDVDVWRATGWTLVLTAMDGRTADSIEQAAVCAWHVIG